MHNVNVNNKATITKNFHNLSNLQKEFEITCMTFGESENEILLGLRNQTVKVYDVQFRSFSQSLDAKVDGGWSIFPCDNTIFVCREGLAVWWE